MGVQRRWHDGSLENDLPFRQLSEMFNVNHFIVSQTNPHLVPLMSLRKVVPASVFNLVQAEIKHAFLQVWRSNYSTSAVATILAKLVRALSYAVFLPFLATT